MRQTAFIPLAILSLSLVLLGLLLAGPIAAKPGWSHPVLGAVKLSPEQQQQMGHLRDAFRAQFEALDWGVENGAHAPETLEKARELQLALRAEMRALLSDEQRAAMDAAQRGSCPYSGQTTPVRASQRNASWIL